MNLIPWKNRPSSLVQFRNEIDELWNRFFEETGNGWPPSHLPEVFSKGHVPSLNITENEDSITVAVDLPGVDQKDVNVEIMGDELVISGERKWESKKEEKELVRMESQFGAFRRVVALPKGLRTKPEDIEAAYKNGILRIRLKKVEPTPSKKVPIKAG